MQEGIKKFNKKVIYGVLMCLMVVTSVFLNFPKVVKASTEHHYISGKVDAVGHGTISVSGTTYKLVSNVKVVKHVKYHGSFYEQPAKFSDIMPGRFVSIKVLAGNVYEVIIEEWKK